MTLPSPSTNALDSVSTRAVPNRTYRVGAKRLQTAPTVWKIRQIPLIGYKTVFTLSTNLRASSLNLLTSQLSNDILNIGILSNKGSWLRLLFLSYYEKIQTYESIGRNNHEFK